MGSRSTGEGVYQVYAAAEKWIERALRSDDSLFIAGQSIWSSRWLSELRERFLDRPDVSGDSFYTKLERQLQGSPPEVYQLMAEALYLHFAPATTVMKGATKKSRIREVLGWSEQPISIPEDLLGALDTGIGNPGTAFNTNRPLNVGFLIEFAQEWKAQTSVEQKRMLGDPWAFKLFLKFAPTSRMFEEVSGDGAYRLQRDALLHLTHPDTFERIFSITHKERITDAYGDLIHEDTNDIDRKLWQIRRGIETALGRDFDFYEDSIRRRWDPPARRQAWDEFVTIARKHWDSGQLDPMENDYKVDIGRRLAEEREAVLANKDNWIETFTRNLPDNPLGWRSKQKFLIWAKGSQAEALEALQAIWTRKTLSVDERIRSFSDLFPISEFSGTGVRMRYMSILLMGIDVYKYPPFLTTYFKKAYDRTGFGQPERDADEAALYEHSLRFLDLFIEEAAERGLTMRHRLDAQSLVWMILRDETTEPDESVDQSEQSKDAARYGLPELAEELLLPESFLREIETLLREKKQVIFQGPPGTGKTYVAQKLAECLAGEDGSITLVQFHPSYAYEDFVQGFRPTLNDDQAGFALRDGPLITAAQRARKDPDADHFLVIDEINRGNLAKVFGELYFLLEYRDRKMRLQYQAEGDEEFSLPENLYIIGTMNTADRSIALVDLALRRRFYFVEFHPDDEPIRSLLRKWLDKNAPGLEWVADIVERANRNLADDRHVAIGPSYFMGTDDSGNALVQDETSVRRIWKHSVLPYIEEHLFGTSDDLDEWDLDKLRRPSTAATREEDGGNEETNQADAAD